MKVGLVSLDQAWEDKTINMINCKSISEEMVRNCPGLDLIIYPEMTLTGFSVRNPNIAESEFESPTLDFFKTLAKHTNCAHIVGISVTNNYGKYFNRCFYIDQFGDVKTQYDKMHTFSHAQENLIYSKGEKPSYIKDKESIIGLSICFDLRFPELYSFYRQHCNIVICIANWPATRKAHWYSLLQARSIENQLFVIGVNRVGIDANNLEYESSSVIYGPDGNAIFESIAGNFYSIYDLNINEVNEYRKLMPFVKDRRPEIYKDFYKG